MPTEQNKILQPNISLRILQGVLNIAGSIFETGTIQPSGLLSCRVWSTYRTKAYIFTQITHGAPIIFQRRKIPQPHGVDILLSVYKVVQMLTHLNCRYMINYNHCLNIEHIPCQKYPPYQSKTLYLTTYKNINLQICSCSVSSLPSP